MILNLRDLPAGTIIGRDAAAHAGRVDLRLPNGACVRVESRHSTTVPNGFNHNFDEDPDDHNTYILITNREAIVGLPTNLMTLYPLRRPLDNRPGHYRGEWQTTSRAEFDHLCGLLSQLDPEVLRR